MLAPLTQYNPHGVFIALEEAGFALVTVAVVALSAAYGVDVEYRFEVAAIAIDWTVLIASGTLLAFHYRARGA
jgi:hypothetical protein